MLAIIDQKRLELMELCRRFHVKQLEIFGSALTEGFDSASSDFDFLVEFEHLPPADYASAFFAFKESLEDIFGRPVDLVVSSAIRNPYFRQSLERCKALLYAA